MSTKKELYILWNNITQIDQAVEVDPCSRTLEEEALSFMDDFNEEEVTLYKLVPVRKYEKTSGVKVTELKGE